ncbi:recombination mediator RecR [Candidatus Omnitrophota bacterium]
MRAYTQSLESLIHRLMKFPGVGRRSAERIVNYILNTSGQEVKSLTDAIVQAKHRVKLCTVCNTLTEDEVCSICQDPKRKKEMVCVVEEPKDVLSIEKTGTFDGCYHVLMGSISPLEGRGPDDLKIKELLTRIEQHGIKEVIIATDSDTEGETTAMYLTKMIKPFGVKVMRIGVGIPVGSNLDYIDPTTISIAIESRREI